ncbi:NAD(P)H-dependent oxidoreductase [Paralimibaculum aggregatum]|uniref:NAD(P)H-dependent oxidoreductase n=1 Tax=Paralimibaculum aggregatum TaxID=3036245 RepID=A0ABQ6LIB8_9RHOB|nr:NAD(P)H-dependent oxidoreductase [Limibaculum sp. NKW23]GMG82181.1 NAD(P)H-dependent oxidoreductase [Limibaculum sp. NKW23]
MTQRICLLLGHPDGQSEHFCHALAAAYARGAEAAGHRVARLDLAALQPEPLGSAAEFETAPAGPMAEARAALADATHLVEIFPLWLGGMPARLKAFFEQLARAGFALGISERGWPEGRLKGRSARVVVTMGMPALAYRIWFLNAGVGVLKRMILGMAGIAPVRQTTIGGVEAMSDAARARWLARVEALGRAAR